MTAPTKQTIRDHWEAESCGVRYGEGDDAETFYRSIEKVRYELEPYIPGFAQFETARDKKILEIGIGAGTDFSRWVRAGADANGIDLTQAAVDHTTRRLSAAGYAEDDFHVQRGDAENLPFSDDTFDLVYSWGVLHCTPDTPKAFREAHRVMKPGAPLRAMVYHVHSWTSWMLWLKNGLFRGKPWLSPRRAVFENLESPGTKVYTKAEAKRLVENAGFQDVRVSTVLGPGDLLKIKRSAKYQNPVYRLAWNLFPRWLVSRIGDRFGLYLLINGTKP